MALKPGAAQAGQAANTAASTAAGLGGQGSQISSTLIPFEERQLATPTGYTPQQMNAMLAAGEQGAGGALSAVQGQANLMAARARNPAGYTMALDQASRQKGQQLSQNALGIQAQNAALQQQQQQGAARALSGLYGTDISSALQAQGLIPRDVQAETQADLMPFQALQMGASGLFGAGKGLIPGLQSL